ncbi:hypothetical protein LEP1GSC021_3486 [Leptospira noguchii str. 1993005606]|nr:hypothetical protein LEP1GSC021_3486 [Leptospira noguchii str. 1993005606]
MAHDLSSDPRSETLSSGKRCAEFFSLQIPSEFFKLNAAHYGSQHNNRFRICYAELTLTIEFFNNSNI